MKSAILTIHEHRPSMDTKYEDMIQSVKRGIATTDESYNSQTYSFHHRPYHSKPYCFWVRRRMTDVESIGWKQNNERRKKNAFCQNHSCTCLKHVKNPSNLWNISYALRLVSSAHQRWLVQMPKTATMMMMIPIMS